ncbi:MAG: cell division protein FtsX [Alphaproteobacteria bacterium]
MFTRNAFDHLFDRRTASRFVPCVIAAMVYLGALALAGAMGMAGAVSGWKTGLTSAISVQILPDRAGKPASPATLGKIAGLLRATPGVARVTIVSERSSRALLEPWLGRGKVAPGLPIPRLISVRLKPNSRLDIAALGKRLRAAAPNIVLDDHRQWLAKALDFARSMELLALIVLALAMATSIAAVAFAARSGLAIHRRVAEILHLIGARDRFIAGQFERQALRHGLTGGLLGLALAALTLLGLGRLLGDIDVFGLGAAEFTPGHWLALIALVPGVTLIAMLSARVSVLRALRRMP